MQDLDGHINLPGFYDKVRSLDAEERADFKRLPQGDELFLEETGARSLWGEDGFTAYERATARPTLDVNGLLSGYTGEGPKTVLPGKAMAKLSCRLVADQLPTEVEKQ